MYILSFIKVTICRYSKSTETDKRLSKYMNNDLSLLPTYIILSLSLLFNTEITNYHYFYQLVLNLVTTAFIVNYSSSGGIFFHLSYTIASVFANSFAFAKISDKCSLQRLYNNMLRQISFNAFSKSDSVSASIPHIKTRYINIPVCHVKFTSQDFT